MQHKRVHTQGFTLIELAVTLAIIAITASIALPSFEEVIHNNRMSSQVNELVASLNIARSEAAKRQVPVIICASSDQSSCDNAAWENGWLVFADNNSNGSIDGAGIDNILQIQAGLEGNNTFRSTFLNPALVEYNAQGNIDPIAGGTLVLCNHWGQTRARGININSTGRIRLATDGPDPGEIAEDISGDDLTCPP